MIEGDEDISMGMTADHEEGDPAEDDTMDGQAPGSLLSKIGQFKNSSLGKSLSSGAQQHHGRMVESSYKSSAPKPDQPLSHSLKPRAPRIDVKLTSVIQLREEVRKQGHPVLTPIFANHTFVGILDNQRGLIQNELALYLIHYEAVSEELFYQLCLRDFSNFGFIRLSTPAPIKEMVLMALDDEQVLMERDEWPEELKPKEEIAEVIIKLTVLDSMFARRCSLIITLFE